MWWVPLATAVVMAGLVLVLHHWHEQRQASQAKIYRGRFIQLVAQLDTVTRGVNDLSQSVRQVREPKLLDYYEGTLRILETLLAAIRRIPPFGDEPGSLDAAFFLVKDCRERLGRTYQGFQDVLRGRELKIDSLYGQTQSNLLTEGCYFCSRPVITGRFTKVKVKLDGEVKEVTSCPVCRGELESTKKVKVLYFMREGQPTHWSQVSDYSPSEDFWSINEKKPIHKTRQLELIYTNPGPQP